VRENVALLDPDARDADVWRALRLAALDTDVAAWPMREHTRVGEHGLALSGGQRQRLALARAVLRPPAALLLDEATSHLDPATEHRVITNLAALRCTQLVIAHRLTTVRDADRIVVLDAGRVAESGSHADLLAAGGRYARLAGAEPHATRPPDPTPPRSRPPAALPGGA
jgi:ABC-type bacteriocin/lantibiotic exporter with double-glycine peptidase domain